MKCEKRKQQILLAQSGELSDKAVRALEAHIEGCERCRRYRDSLTDVLAASGSALRSGIPSDRTLHRIKVAALNREDRAPIVFARPVVLTLAAAAALVVAVGLWTAMPPVEATDPAGDLDAIMMMVRYYDAEETSYPAANRPKTVRELADDLLSMEGFAVDEFSEEEWFILDEEPPATGLRSRSTPDSGAKTCV